MTMGSCEYKEVFTDAGVELQVSEKTAWKPLLRQTIICLGVCSAYFLLGVFKGSPTVIVSQMRRDSNDTVTDEMLSWLTSTNIISSVPFLVILPLLFNKIGRKLTFLFVWLSLLIAFIIFYLSTNLYHIVISAVFVGIGAAAMTTIAPVLISEYTSPKYRGIFLTLKSASLFWGVWVSNALGTFFPWKNIAIVSFVCSIYMLSVLLWPESPYYLAMKGRYAESAKSHRLLKGVSENSEKELAQLINLKKKMHNIPPARDRNNFCFFIKDLWLTITSRPFYKPALISITLFGQYQFSGKLVITMYAIDVLKNLTQDKNFVYKEMLILDGVTVFSMYIGCILTRYLKRRTMLLLFSTTEILLLYILSLYTYLVYLSILKENPIIVLLLLSIFSIAAACGPMILTTSIFGEIAPTRYQKLFMILVGLCCNTSLALILKFSPIMFATLKMHGCFLFYAISSTIFLSISYVYLPETKDRTIQEIEEYFNGTPKVNDTVAQLADCRKLDSRFDSGLVQKLL